ncbi:uridine kinase [Thermosipho melanesiensis]|uniref:Uridine kinase n=2 Tax=Thermosipho melanesiensis TaxID=46541 RepID=A6LMR1_THEM4|nr:uridine kinase [Thermosipho melanesiensis]ABR31212.1 uridine kinase [Thermosipho melanesiensis BI429]APT74296.1 uridine kinase [Thermosipho melanesiensis]OOC36237.1 uridine kinase [Thermosipho melanesiensis]OOC37055.1 uridine kinase [Thermosipho melanesiensis]OOC37807.1 uridine kinase [Thermosipho melanesiensis]
MFVIGIGGGTGSGKTTVAQKINEIIGKENSVILPMDNYYRDMSYVPLEERKKYNYDHPNMIEVSLLEKHLKNLLELKSIKLPEYDFKIYTRTGKFTILEPRPVIIVEGIFALYYEELRKMYNLSIFVDAESDVRFIRRLERDIKERGRSLDSVVEQYLNMVKPMHDAYVEPSKKFADLIIPKGGFNDKAIDVVVEFIFKKMTNN